MDADAKRMVGQPAPPPSSPPITESDCMRHGAFTMLRAVVGMPSRTRTGGRRSCDLRQLRSCAAARRDHLDDGLLAHARRTGVAAAPVESQLETGLLRASLRGL